MTFSPPGRDRVGLVVARTQGDFLVHLGVPAGGQSLCGQVLRPRPPQKSFREAGCRQCLGIALGAGHVAVLEGDRSWINLRRVQTVVA
jgi:hypothetical protein